MSVSAPPKSKYNPAATKLPHPPACIWELLRRHPAFRHLVGQCESLVSTPAPGDVSAGKEVVSIRERTTRLIPGRLTWLYAHNPFAACALNWSLRPKMVELSLHRPLRKFFTPMNGNTGEWIRLGIPQMGRRELRTMERLIKSDFLGHTFPGPLTSTSGTFNLNMPWPQTPPLFRFHFQWLWAEFDPSLSGINGRPFIPFLYDVQPAQSSGLVTLPWDWAALRELGAGDTLDLKQATALDDVADLFMHHFVFRVPKAALSKRERRYLVKKISEQLEELTTEQGIATSTKKVRGLLGSEKEWEHFSYCREFIPYEQESPKPMTLEKSEKHKEVIFSDCAKQRQQDGKIKDTTNPTKSIRDGYAAIERLMFHVYPQFDWPSIMHDRMGVSKTITQRVLKRALEVCQRKLEVGFRSRAE